MFLIPRVWAIARPRNVSTPCATRFFRHTATTSNLDASPRQSKGAATSQLPKPRRVLRTLDPQRIQPQDFVDISNYKQPRFFKSGSQLVILHYGKTFGRIPFPPKSHGFLYYHHDPKLPLTTGEIRFRLTPRDDPAQFQNGQDLKDIHGKPWAISLLTMTKSSYEPLRMLVLEDELVDPNLMRVIQESLSLNKFHRHVTPLHYLEHPFSLNVARTNHFIRIFTPRKLGVMAISSIFNDRRKENTKGAVPYSGRILVRFERSTLPQHAGTRSVVLRVLDIIEPIRVAHPGYDMYLPIPKKGCLVETHSSGLHPGAPRPWSINLDRPVRAWGDIGLLYPESE
ncbi:hypothetical protein FPV67DRAFT_782767 [Lyophyllum atratum]|nr:hypothetical protein FPV67DRAFT_782767 [Lyophyllum atratum]